MERRSRSKTRVGALAGAAAVAALAFPALASANVNSAVDGAGKLTVTSDAGDAITITCVTNDVKVNGADPTPGGAADCDDVKAIDVTGDAAANVINLAGVEDADAAVDTDYPNVLTVEIDGGGGNDTITGSEHVDEMLGGEGNDRIIGDENNVPGSRDLFKGEAGDDTLVWNGGHDDDTMDGGDGSDTIEVNGAAAFGETFTVKPSATPGRVQFDRAAPTPTPPGLFNLDIGTSERLDLNMSGGNDTFTADPGLAALGFALDVDAGAGDDTVDGGDGADLLLGGDGNDTITPDDNPPGTLDDARGDAGDDTIVWNGGDDDDRNEGGDGNDTIQVNGAPLPEEFTVKPSATAGRIRFDRLTTPPGPFFIDIGTAERLDLNANGGNDTLTTAVGTATTFKLDVEGGDGDDSLDGGDAADLLSGGNGTDRLVGDDNPAGTRDDVRGDAGDDTMVWNAGDDDDLNEGGEGADTSEVNGGSGGEDFTVKPSPTAGRVLFDRTGPTPPGPFNVDIGTTEDLVLNAGDGNDRIIGAKRGLAGLIKSTLNGDGGNDRIVGTDGEDSLGGGDGSDILNSRDKAEDRVDCGSGLDLAKVDKRDFLRGCNIAIGGHLKVKQVGSKRLDAAAGGAAVTLRCVRTKRCSGKVALRRGGKTLAAGKFRMNRGKSKTVSMKLTGRGRRVAAGAPSKGVRASLVIDAKDGKGNGWRTTSRVKLAS
jgi:Ca2+-binding RTX toxin-like protein